MSAAELVCDVAIVGGGLAGSALAHALAQTPLDVALIEARDPQRLQQPSFDDRATALANGSQRILSSLGLWERVASSAEAIRTIHISERGHFGAARIVASDEGVPALGYMLENRILGAALWEALDRARRFTSIAPATLAEISPGPDEIVIGVDTGGGRRTVRARLLIAADGASSRVRDELGITVVADDYRQQAVVLNCRTEAPHRGRAFERFTADGPMAMLPLCGDRVAAVWTLPGAEAEAAMQLDDAAFARALQQAFGYRLGRIEEVGRRSAYPLQRIRSTSIRAPRTALIGSAAVNLHPVAGQGFNLALRDVAVLAEVLSDALLEAGGSIDPGADALLERFQAWRRQDHERVAVFTHSLIQLFAADSLPLEASRGFGLMAFDLVPGAKAALARQTMGLSGRLTRLARGLPLIPPPGMP